MDSTVMLLLIVLASSAFVKIATTLMVFRYGAGLTGIEFGVVTLIVSAVIGWATVPPPISEMNQKVFLNGGLSKEELQVEMGKVVHQLPAHIEKKIDEKVLRVFQKESRPEQMEVNASSLLRVQLPALVISELKVALALGVSLLIPFVVIDVLIAHLLTLLGIQQLAAATVSLPLKVIVFLSVNGWEMLIGKLIS